MRARDAQEYLLHLLDIARLRHPHRDAEPHPRVLMAPVDDLLFDEPRVRNDDRDVVIRHHGRAPYAYVAHPPGDAVDLHPVAYLDRAFGQDDETADEVARDVLQAEYQPHAHRSREHGERGKVHPRVLQRDQDAGHEHHVAEYLAHGVLQRLVHAAAGQEALHQEFLPPRGKPEDDGHEHDEPQQAAEADADARDRRLPRDWQARAVQPRHGESEEHAQPQHGRDERHEVFLQTEALQETPHRVALEKTRDRQSRHDAASKSDESRDGKETPEDRVLLVKEPVHEEEI